MILAELFANLETLDDNLTIYARADPEWSPTSEATVCVPPDDGTTVPPLAAAGMDYFLEVYIAKEVLQGWARSAGGKELSLQRICDILINYAQNDA